MILNQTLTDVLIFVVYCKYPAWESNLKIPNDNHDSPNTYFMIFLTGARKVQFRNNWDFKGHTLADSMYCPAVE